MKKTQISQGRKQVFYLGRILTVIGLILFFSVFISFIAMLSGSPFGGHDVSGVRFERFLASDALRAFGGIFLCMIGGYMSFIGRLGAAGSGVVLDPEQARRDVEPWSRMAGGVVNDALEEVEGVDRFAGRPAGAGEERVKVRCRKCRALNDEDARFCGQCGAEL